MGLGESIFGKKPEVPKLEKLDLGAEQQKAIQNNLTALPGAEELVSKANLFSREQINQMLASAGGGDLLSNSAGQINKMIAGELPLSDQQSSQLSSVAKSFGGGYAGSGAMGNLVARDLGLKTLDVIGKGLNSAESWLRTTAALYEPSMMNLSSMFLTPAQQYAADNEQNLQQFQRQFMRNQIKAMPDPVLAGIHAEIASYASAFLGGSGQANASGFQQNYSGLGQGLQPNYGGGFMDTTQPGMDWGGSFDSPGIESTGGAGVGGGYDFGGGGGDMGGFGGFGGLV